MAKDGAFIVFEGLDGSGISTHSALLGKWLQKMGKRIYLTKEPSEGPIGFLIRQALNGHFKTFPKFPDIMSLLFAADRLYHLNAEVYGPGDRESSGQIGITKAKREGYYVISDRYLLSALAYQSVPVGDRSVDLDWMLEMNKFAVDPDITIFIDTPPEICLKRIAVERWKFQMFENYPDLKLAYEGFHEIIEKWKGRKKIFVVKGVDENNRERPIEEVHAEICGIVEKQLTK